MSDQATNHEPATFHTVSDYAAAVAAGTAAPGGGSVAGVVAALGAALGGMVGRLTIAKPPSDDLEGTGKAIRAALADLDQARATLLQLAADDERAYGEYITATRLPKQTEAEQAARRATQQAALVTAAEVPLGVAKGCRATLAAMRVVAESGRKHILPDVSVGAWLAEAAARGALLNIQANADLMADSDQGNTYRDQAETLRSELERLAAETHAVIERRLNG